MGRRSARKVERNLDNVDKFFGETRGTIARFLEEQPKFGARMDGGQRSTFAEFQIPSYVFHIELKASVIWVNVVGASLPPSLKDAPDW